MRVVLVGLVVGLFGGRVARAQDPSDVLVPEGEPASILEGADWVGMEDVKAVAYSPDGKIVAAGARQGVLLWDAASGREIRRLAGRTSYVTTVAFSPDGKLLASGSLDGMVHLWDVASGSEIHSFEGHTSYVASVTFSPDGKLLASGSMDDTVRLWGVIAAREIRILKGHTKLVTSVAFSPDGKSLASGSADKTVRLWDMASGSEIYAFEGHTNDVNSVAFSPDGKLLASGSADKTVRLWNVASGHKLLTFEGHADGVASIAFNPDGKILASGSADKMVRLWDVASGHKLLTFEGHTRGVASVAFSPDGKTLASGSADDSVRLWDVASGRSLQVLKEHATWITSIAFSPDGRLLASGSVDNRVHLWDVTSGHEIHTFEGHTRTVTSVAFAPDGKALASASFDETVRLWDVASGRWLRTFDGHASAITSVMFSPDGKLLAFGGWDNAVHLWDVAFGRSIRTFEGHTGSVESVAFSPDGQRLASGSLDHTVRLWDVASGHEIHTFEGHTDRVDSVAFGPDGKLLASGSGDTTVRLWDVDAEREIRSFTATKGFVSSVTFAQVGKFLASGALNNDVRFWDVDSGRLLQTFEKHNGPVTSVAFSPDGRFLASGSGDGSIRLSQLHDPISRDRILRTGLAGWLSSSPDGRVFRHDDGRFLYHANPDGALTPVLPTQPEHPPDLHLSARVITDLGEKVDGGTGRTVGRLALSVTNASAASRAYWLRVQAVDPPVGLVLLPPPMILRLEPNETSEMLVDFYWLSSKYEPVNVTTTLHLKVVHAYGESASIEISLKPYAPMLQLFARGDVEHGTMHFRFGDVRSGTVVIIVLNDGNQDSGPLRVHVTFELFDKEVSGEGEYALNNLDARSTAGWRVAIPLPTTVRIARRFAVRLDITTDTSGAPTPLLRTWTLRADNLRIGLPPLVYAAAALTALLLAFGLAYARIYRNPLVVHIAATPTALKLLPFPTLPAADRALRRARRLDASLSIAALPLTRWQRALAPDRLAAFAEALGATLGTPIPGTPPSTRALEITLPGLRLRFAQQTAVVLVEGPNLEAGTAAALAAAIHRNGAGPRQALILDLSETQQALTRVRQIPSVAFVVLSADRLRDLLLADQPAEVLEATLVEQLKVADLSPYQTAGGVEQDALFFGRERELRTMADRTLRNFLLVGPRQMGKSTLLKGLERRLRQRPDVEAHYLTLADGDVTAHLAHHLDPEAKAAESSPERFRALAAGTRDKPRLWLIDEADAFVEEDTKQGHAITRTMRALSQDGLAYFVLTGYWHLYAATVLDRDHPLLNFAEVMRLGPLDEASARALATEPVEALGLHWDEASTLDHLVHGAGRRANLIVLACKGMIEALGPADHVLTRELLSAKRRSGDLSEALRPLRTYPDALDRLIVAQSFLLGEPTADEVRAALEARGVDASGTEIEQAFDRLMLGYLLLRDDGGRLVCPVPFVREAILRERNLEDRLRDDGDAWTERRKKERAGRS